MDVEIIILNEDRKTNIICYYYMWNLIKNDTNELIYKTETEKDFENKLMVTKWEMSGVRINYQLEINNTIIYKITTRDLLYSIGNSTQYSAITYVGKISEKNKCITESFCCTPIINIINYTSEFFKK